MRKLVLPLSLFLFVISITAQTPETTVAKASAAPSQSADTPKPYVFGVGDEIAGKVMGEADYNFEATVDENGQILLPFSGTPIMARCKTETELKADIQKLLERDLKNPQWSLRTTKRATPVVTVFGEVNTKSTFELKRRATLFELIALAGGANKDAGQIVQVYRPHRITCTGDEDPNNWKGESGDPSEVPFKVFNLAAMEKGNITDNPVIMPGDVIFVPQAAPVYVVGEVIAPQGILLKKDGGTTVMEAISMVQGLRPEAKKKDIKIYRKRLGYEQREPISVNLEMVNKGLQKDIFLEPYDLVVVDKTKKSIALTIAEFALGAGRSIITSAANQTGVRVVY